MGVTFSGANSLCCCGFPWRSSFHDPDEESLLRNQQEGYGSMKNNANGSYDMVQEQMREHERRLQARDQELRGIVASTNDKLIDISMISNSGIVIQKSDLYTEDVDEEESDENSDSNTTDSPIQQQVMELNTTGGPSNNSNNNNDNNNNSNNSKVEISPESDTLTHFTVLAEEEVTPEMKQTLKEMHQNIMDQLTKQITTEAPQDLIFGF